ncbi:MAG TPA: FAD-dependent oxidoreductase [Acidobacteriaceae bacterium]|nr:FAD-dependent oxidoreductase [Acidobacteriaceae bacterium]
MAVFGAGVAGLTAAHELIQRGFQVTVYEPRRMFGGKARSLPVPRSARGQRKPLPAEHGFRLFPAFYRHIPDTLRRIPFGRNRNGVLDNLISVDRTLFASTGQRGLCFPVRVPRDRADIVSWSAAFVDATRAWVPVADSMFFIHRMLVLLTSCDRRRETELDHITWVDFMDAKRRSSNYQRYLAGGLTRSLVAMNAEEGSARTLGLILQALMFDTLSPGRSSDRVLIGPTNEVWIDPWVAQLQTLGVKFVCGALRRLIVRDNRIGGAVIALSSGVEREVTAGEYLLALPHEILNSIIADDVKEAAPSLARLDRLRSAWMNGIQYYLDRDVPVVEGHCILVDSPWALTSISQRQFWTGTELADYGDGTVQGILSVDISDWNTPGILYGRAAKHCSAEEISKEVWAQLKMHLNVGGVRILHDAAIRSWYLDPSIEFKSKREPTNLEPLFINSVGTLKFRPNAETEIDNLSVAGDFVRTNTDLATMEAANEAARRAVNAILARAGSYYSTCEIWPLPEPEVLRPLKTLDSRRFQRGEPHAWYDGTTNTLGEAFRGRIHGLGDRLRRLVGQ